MQFDGGMEWNASERIHFNNVLGVNVISNEYYTKYTGNLPIKHITKCLHFILWLDIYVVMILDTLFRLQCHQCQMI